MPNKVILGLAGIVLAATAGCARHKQAALPTLDAPRAEIVDLPAINTSYGTFLDPAFKLQTHPELSAIEGDMRGKPGILYIPWIRESGKRQQAIAIFEEAETGRRAMGIAAALYDEGLAKHLLIEGTTDDLSANHARTGMVAPLVIACKQGGRLARQYVDFATSRPWKMLGTQFEDRSLFSSALEIINQEHAETFEGILSSWQQQGFMDQPAIFESNKTKIFGDLMKILKSYDAAICTYYETDPGASAIYRHKAIEPQQAAVDAAKNAIAQGAKKVILVYDHRAEENLREFSLAAGLDFCVLRPKDMPVHHARSADERQRRFRLDRYIFGDKVEMHTGTITYTITTHMTTSQSYQKAHGARPSSRVPITTTLPQP